MRKNKKPSLKKIRASAGKLGGSVTSRAKAKAARHNGAKGGRPRKVQGMTGENT